MDFDYIIRQQIAHDVKLKTRNLIWKCVSWELFKEVNNIMNISLIHEQSTIYKELTITMHTTEP